MEEIKILFADLYRLIGRAKDGVKTIDKANDLIMGLTDWSNITISLGGIVNEAEILKAIAESIVKNIDVFLNNGPYEGQGANITPLESLAQRQE